MRVFIAGATGVLGRELVAQLIASGHQVAGMTRSPSKVDQLRSAGAEAVVCDALDRDALRTAVARAQPEAVIHALTDLPDEFRPRRFASQLEATNRLRRTGTSNLLAAAKEAGASRIVAESIAFAYRPEGDWVKSEDAPIGSGGSATPSDAIDAVAELEQRVLADDGIVLRYGYFYGPGTHFDADGFYAGLIRKRQLPLITGAEGRWSFIHVRDAASATVAALAKGSPGAYNIVDDDPAPAADWIPVLAEAIGGKRPLRLPAWIVRLAAGPTVVAGMTDARGASNAKAKHELGWEPSYSSWRDGFRSAAG